MAKYGFLFTAIVVGAAFASSGALAMIEGDPSKDPPSTGNSCVPSRTLGKCTNTGRGVYCMITVCGPSAFDGSCGCHTEIFRN